MQAFIAMVALFGFIHWTEAQIGGVMGFLATVLAPFTRRAVTALAPRKAPPPQG